MNVLKVFSRNDPIDITDLQAKDIDIKGIAHSLALQCRWNGHCNKFMSVAEHCVLGSIFLEKSMLCGKTEHAMQFLLHDSFEAYMSDIIQPIKRHILIKEYDELLLPSDIEDDGLHEILKHFNVDTNLSDCVKKTDIHMTVLEERSLFDTPSIVLIQDEEWYKKMSDHIKINCWECKEAEAMFIHQFERLKNMMAKEKR